MALESGSAVRLVNQLGDLPIDVAEAMYSPDFVELTTLDAAGTPRALPMSFTLDIAGNVVRFSSPINAARLINLQRDPRCCVSFSRVTTGHPPLVLQGIATLGESAEGVRRGPSRRFTVAPVRLLVLSEPAMMWSFPVTAPLIAGDDSAERGRSIAGRVRTEDLDALPRFETTVAGLRDLDGWPLNLPIEIQRDGDALTAALPDHDGLIVVGGPASLLGHTWTKNGPRYLAVTGRASIDGSALRCQPIRALRRP